MFKTILLVVAGFAVFSQPVFAQAEADEVQEAEKAVAEAAAKLERLKNAKKEEAVKPKETVKPKQNGAARLEKLKSLRFQRDAAEEKLIKAASPGWALWMSMGGAASSMFGLGAVAAAASASAGGGGTINQQYGYATGVCCMSIGGLLAIGGLVGILISDVDEVEKDYKQKRTAFDEEAMAF